MIEELLSQIKAKKFTKKEFKPSLDNRIGFLLKDISNENYKKMIDDIEKTNLSLRYKNLY